MSRDSIHNRIDELLGLLSINNSRLSLHSEKLSQLDIDVLRKQCIDLYDEVNILALQGKIKSEIAVPVVDNMLEPAKTPQILDEEPVIDLVKESPKDESVEVIERTTEDKEEKKSDSSTKPKGVKREDEMLSLFEKFSSKPIESIAKGMTVAKRFEFQSAFFEGDNKEYKQFMSSLDAAGGRDAAFALYHEYKIKYQWDNEELKDELKSLMYRKYA
jgi:hypothetical protein